MQPRVHYAQPPHLFRNLGREEVRGRDRGSRAALTRADGRRAARPTATTTTTAISTCVVTVNNGAGAPASATTAPSANNVLRVQTIGTTSNRDGIGARVELALAGGAKPWQMVKTGSSYCSQSELPLTFGLGAAGEVAGIRVTWPGGRIGFDRSRESESARGDQGGQRPPAIHTAEPQISC